MFQNHCSFFPSLFNDVYVPNDKVNDIYLYTSSHRSAKLRLAVSSDLQELRDASSPARADWRSLRVA